MSEKNKTKEVKINLKSILLIAMILLVLLVILIQTYFNKLGKIDSAQNNKTNTATIEITEFNEEDAITLLNKYLEERSLAYSNPQALLEKYSFATNQEFSNFEKTTDEKFLRTNIIYEDVRNEMQKYITKDFFAKQFKNIYKNSNGITHVAILNVSKENYQITRYEHLESNTKEIMNVWYKVTKDEVTSEEKNMKVEFSKINEKWIISDIK
ncbi:MAG: hypothetical protein J6K45_05850 [Clostridia bacterium]|nr:hypothetical protein [Clostridia bacterium]